MTELTILMPCLNEAETLAVCVKKAAGFLQRTGIDGEIIVADNGSIDGSQEIARGCGARVVDVSSRGYGSALRAGIENARGKFVIMGDSDDSYDFSALDAIVEKLRLGFQLVMGNRFQGGILPGAMPPLHRYLGNPVLTGLGRLFFRSPCGDFHCGLRGFDREAVLGLHLQSPGMEFASEMVVKATIHGLSLTEVPVKLHPDGRTRPPHLRSWRDGWRHLRFLLLFSPKWLFLYPGLSLATVGLLLVAWLVAGPQRMLGVVFDVHTLYYASLATVIGLHSVIFWLFSNIHGMREGIVPIDPRFLNWIGRATLERCLIVGSLFVAAGIVLGVVATQRWSAVNFGGLNVDSTMRLVIPSGMFMMIGLHLIYGGFFLGFLNIKSGAE